MDSKPEPEEDSSDIVDFFCDNMYDDEFHENKGQIVESKTSEAAIGGDSNKGNQFNWSQMQRFAISYCPIDKSYKNLDGFKKLQYESLQDWIKDT